LTLIFGAGNEPTVEECDQIFANWFDGTKSTISALRLTSEDENENEENQSYMYVKAVDENSNILQMRSVPSAKDEIYEDGGKYWYRQNVGTKILPSTGWSYRQLSNDGQYHIISQLFDDISAITSQSSNTIAFEDTSFSVRRVAGINSAAALTQKCINLHDQTNIPHIYVLIPLSAYEYDTNNTGANQYASAALGGLTLNYQLAEPVEIPVQVSGTLTSYPNGTIIVLRELPDAGIYTDKMEILHRDAPIKRLDRLSKVDFYTGVETELDVSEAVIAEDKLSFTHPELNAGDIVFFEYEYDVESTEGETEVEFYDSRYVVKDTETGKFYKWNIVVTNGQPSIELVEV
jgi:hypothetical protein